jgi:hypothetical protein
MEEQDSSIRQLLPLELLVTLGPKFIELIVVCTRWSWQQLKSLERPPVRSGQ